jgi:hypothetical protein
VRCIIDYDGENDECASVGDYRDNDDANFTVSSSTFYCTNISTSCSTCTIGECGTNCSVRGCSQQTQQQLSCDNALCYLNISVPSGTGLEDLWMNINYTTDSVTFNVTEPDCLDYGGEEPPTSTKRYVPQNYEYDDFDFI